MQRTAIAVAEVAEEIRLHVAFGEEFLFTAETRLAGGKEFLIDFRVVEAGQRSAIETDSPRSHDHVGALQTGIPLRRRLDELCVALKEIRHPGFVRKQLPQVLVELQVVTYDHGDRSGHRLLDIERGERGS